MEYLPCKLKVLFKLICCFVVTLIINSCYNSDTTPDCGCESETLRTIPKSANLIGRIVYKTQIDPNDNYYNDYFWITYIEQNCFNCIHHMIICNEEILGSNFNDLFDLGEVEFIEVKFSGHLKEICIKKIDIADVTYERIVLTSIERQ